MIRRRRLIWAVLVGVAVIAGVVLAAVAAGLFGPRDPVQAGGHGSGQASGDRDDWTAAVCSDGSVSQPSSANFRFPDAIDIAYCTARPSQPGDVSVSLMIGDWPSGVLVGEELARYPAFNYFAAASTGDRTVVFAPTTDADRSMLAPLERFGFTVAALP